MPKSHPPYPAEFRRQMVELVRSGRTSESLAQEFEPTAQSIRNWVAQADRDEGRRSDGLTSAERAELTKLRGENQRRGTAARAPSGARQPAAEAFGCLGRIQRADRRPRPLRTPARRQHLTGRFRHRLLRPEPPAPVSGLGRQDRPQLHRRHPHRPRRPGVEFGDHRHGPFHRYACHRRGRREPRAVRPATAARL